MSDDEVARVIAGSMPCSIELPAGCGKTHTIARLVQLLAESRQRTLVLTHTHSGVDALRRRLRSFGLDRGSYSVRTIDSWCLDLIRSYPLLSGIRVPEEPDWRESPQYHEAGRLLVGNRVMITVIQASYDALIVDEYQDCQIWQHRLVEELSRSVPTAVFGDRMQGLLFFGDNEPVAWESDVCQLFPKVELPVTPHRWVGRNLDLGWWLLEARSKLLNGESVDLRDGPLTLVSRPNTLNAFHGQPRHPIRTCGITRFPKECHMLAARLGGAYTMIEELEGKVMLAFADVIDSGDCAAIARSTVQFAVDCAYGVADAFTMSDRTRLGSGRVLAGLRLSRFSEQVGALNALVSGQCTPATIRAALMALHRLPRFRLFRREAWIGMDRALAAAAVDSTLTSRQAVVVQRNRLRLTGRYPESRILARPLLIKGLEFDCAVVVDAESYNAHELYVALTRGRDQLTVVSNRAVLAPQRPG